MKKFFLAVSLLLMSFVPNMSAMTTITVGSGQSIASLVNAAANGSPGSCGPASGWRPPIQAGICVHVPNVSNISGGEITNSTGTSTAPIVIIADSKWASFVNNTLVVNNHSGVNTRWIYIEGLHWNTPTNPAAIMLGPGGNRFVEYNLAENMDTANGCDNPRGGVIQETFPPADHDTFNGNVVRHWGAAGCNSNGYQGLYIDGAAATITNNVISGGADGWGIQKQYAGGTDCTPGTISNNTIFNNAGGIVINDEGSSCRFKNWTMNNNIIVNNGCSGCGTGGRDGIDWFSALQATNTLASNNLIYGNAPNNVECVGGTTCPALVNTKTDSAVTTTFVNFVLDSGSSPAANYNYANYQVKTTSAAYQGGASPTTCAPSPGINPCEPTNDVGLSGTRTVPYTIGAWQLTTSSAPNPPTGVNVVVTQFFGFDQITSGVWQPVCILPACNPGGVSPPTSTNLLFNQASPSLDGNSMQVSINGPARANALWPAYIVVNDSTVGMNLDLWFFVSPNGALIAQHEFDLYLFSSSTGKEFMWGTQCNKDTGLWQIFNQGTLSWVNPTTVIPCNVTNNTWHHLQLAVHRVAGDVGNCPGPQPCQYFDTLTYDGTSYVINQALSAGNLPTGWASIVGFQVELNTGASGTSGATVTQNMDKVFTTYR